MTELQENLEKIRHGMYKLKLLKNDKKESKLQLVLRLTELLKTIYVNDIKYSSVHYNYCVFVKKQLETKIKELSLIFKENDITVDNKNKKYIVIEDNDDDDECEITYDNQNIKCIVIEDKKQRKDIVYSEDDESETELVMNIE